MDSLQKRQSIMEIVVIATVAVLLAYASPFPKQVTQLGLEDLYLTVAIAEGKLSVETPIAAYGYPIATEFVNGRMVAPHPLGPGYVASIPFRLMRDPAAPPPLAELRRFVDLSAGIPIALLGFVFLRRLLRRQLLDGPAIDVGSLGIFLGLPVIGFASHLSTTGLLVTLILGYLLAVRSFETRPHPVWRGTFLGFAAGAAIGWAALSHPAGAPLGVLLAAHALTGPMRWHRPAIASLLLAAAGGWAFWWQLNRLVGPAWHGLAFVEPDLAALGTDLIGLGRGLVWVSPFLVLAPFGFVSLMRQDARRLALVLLGVAITALTLMVFTGDASTLTIAALSLGILACHGIDALGSLPLSYAVSRGLTIASIWTSVVLWVVCFRILPLDDTIWSTFSSLLHTEIARPNMGQSMGLDGLGSFAPAMWLVLSLGLGLAVRGITDLVGTTSRAIALVSTLLVAVVCVGAATQYAGTWTPSAQEKVLRDYSPLHQRQRGMREGMNQVIRNLDEMD